MCKFYHCTQTALQITILVYMTVCEKNGMTILNEELI